MLSPKLILLASGALVLSALLQLVTTYLQVHYLDSAQCSCKEPDAFGLPSSANFENEYSWLDGDYPPYLPLPLGPPVALTLEDSRHYALSSADADAEWESVYPGGGLGFVRLGPHKRFFSLSMFHQMHCLDSLRRAVLGREHSHGAREGGSGEEEVLHGRDVEHSAHCLNYLRQTVLCAADLTLEPEIGEEGSQEVGEGLGVTHVCRDWGKVYDFAKRNWEQWEAGKVNISRTNRS